MILQMKTLVKFIKERLYGVKVDINSCLDLLSKNNSFGLKLTDCICINTHEVYLPGKLNLYFVQ